MGSIINRGAAGFSGIAALAVAGSVQAASVSYLLDNSNVLPDGEPYLRVTIDDEGVAGLINFTVTTLDTLNDAALRRNFGIQKFSFNTTLATASMPDSVIVDLPSRWSGNVTPPSRRMSGFGRFELTVRADRGRDRLSTLEFSIDVPGDTIFDYYALSSGRAGQGNAVFAAHVAGFDGPYCITSGYFGGAPAAVPVPAAVWLLGSGLLGLAGFARRRRR